MLYLSYLNFFYQYKKQRVGEKKRKEKRKSALDQLFAERDFIHFFFLMFLDLENVPIHSGMDIMYALVAFSKSFLYMELLP